MSGHIFVSYARPDAGYVGGLVDFLRAGGLDVWVDEEIGSGERWERTLREKIDTCAALVVVMSPHAEQSEWVTAELHRARNQRKPLFPLLLAGSVFFSLGHLQYVDVSGGSMPGGDFVTSLTDALNGGSSAPRVPGLRAEGPAVESSAGPTATSSARVPWMAKPVSASTVDRPGLTDQIVDALIGGPRTTVGVTGLYGAGGFGKTTIARLVCQRPQVRARFTGGILWAEIGQDRHGADLTTLIGDLCRQLTNQRPDFTDADQAGYHLGELLASRPPALLVIDDVWTPAQLAPFLHGDTVTRLVTTRIANLIPLEATAVQVDQMDFTHARELLLHGLPPLADDVVAQLLRLTGNWALPTAMANGALRRTLRRSSDPTAAATALAQRLTVHGPASLDLGSTHSREQTFTATVESSLALLAPGQRQRFLELAVFPEDTDVPVSVVASLWSSTAELSPVQAEGLCEELAELSLFADYRAGVAVRLHDVIRSYIRHELGPDRLREANAALLRGFSGQLESSASTGTRAWWTLPDDADYLWRQLGHHLAEAGLTEELTALVLDLRWIDEKTSRYGVADVETDLRRSADPTAAVLRRALVREGHLLGPVEPAHSHADILISRLEPVPQVERLVAQFRHRRPVGVYRLTNFWSLPDTSLDTIRVLTGHAGSVRSVAIAADGTWIATTGSDSTVRIWDASSGAQRAVLTGHTARARGLAIAPNGRWLASTGNDRTVRIWDVAGASLRATLRGHHGRVNAVAISPDGTWLASTGNDQTVRIWDAVTGDPRARLTGHSGRVYGVAIAPDGRWLATTGNDATIRIWDAATGTERSALTGHSGRVNAVAIAADGTWLASTGDDRTVRIWDAASGEPRAVLVAHANTVNGVAIAPDGTWLASTGDDATLRIWDAVTGVERAVLGGHTSWVTGVAIAPDGRWLASTGNDPTARISDAATGSPRSLSRGRAHWVNGAAVAPDGTWVATTGNDKRARIWDAETGERRLTLTGHTSRANGVATSPDGTWLVTTSDDRTARIWDATTGESLAVLAGHTSRVSTVAIGPDGRWLATTSDDRTVRIWDTETATIRATLSDHTGRVTGVAVAPDGSWLASTSDDTTTRIWDVATGEVRLTLLGHTSRVNAVAIAPDGSWLATAGDDGTVRIWDAGTGATRTVIAGHTRWVRAVAIDATGSWLASSGDDRLIRIWDVAGRPLASMRADGMLTAVCWRPDSLGVYVAGNRGVYAFAFDRTEPA